MNKIDARCMRDFFKIKAVARQRGLGVGLRSVGCPRPAEIRLMTKGVANKPDKEETKRHSCDAVTRHLPVSSLNAFLKTSGVT